MNQKVYSKNTDESLDECKQVQMNVDKSQTNVDESRQVQTSAQTSVDESLDDCRQMQASVEKSKFFTLIPEKVTYRPVFLLLQIGNHANYAISAIMQIFKSFIVLSAIIAHHIVFTPQINKTHLPISSLNVRELILNSCSKDQSRKMRAPHAWGVGSPTPSRKTLRFIKRSSLSVQRYASSEYGSV